jgi:cobalt/nickel transport system ATP-binding protein
MEAIIATRSLDYVYPDGTKALKDINVSIERGLKVAFIGPNGAGKSTFLLHLNGILRPTRGEVFIEGKPLKYDKQSLKKVRQKVGMVFQNPDDQLFAPQVWQDVAFGPRNIGLPESEVRERVDKALKMVGIEHLAEKPPHFLSVGQKKRAAIAGILAMDPEILVLDEPLSHLDPQGRNELIEILDDLSFLGKTILVATHSVEFAYFWADYIYVLISGTIKSSGTPDEIFNDSELLSSAMLESPTLVEIYNELKDRKSILGKKTPKSRLDLISMLDVPFLKYIEAPEGIREGDTVELAIENGNLKILGVADSSSDNNLGEIVEIVNGELAAVKILSPGGIKRRGKIFICSVDSLEKSKLFEFLDNNDIKHIGAKGTRAKLYARRENIPMDIKRDVINETMLKALSGKKVLLIVSDGMVEATRKLLEDCIKENGYDLSIDILARELKGDQVG